MTATPLPGQPAAPADRRWSDTDQELVALALAGRVRYSQHGQRCPVWTRAKGVEIGENRAPTEAELARCDCWIMARARRDGGAVLVALTAAGWRREAGRGERMAAVLADLDRVLPDGSGTHHVDCWRHHTACLAARIRAVLTESEDR